MKVFQVKLKLYILKDIQLIDVQTEISRLIDRGLGRDEKLLELHTDNHFKPYCFDYLYPLEPDKVYKQDKVYTLTIRTIDKNVAEYFANKLVNEYNDTLKALKSEISIVPKKTIEKIYSITPAVIKNEQGYWKNAISFQEYERRLKDNLIKKYNYVIDAKMDEDFELYTLIEFKNIKPINTSYKGVNLLGDKLSMNIADNERAQELAYLSLGVGLLEMNTRGYGFMNFRWV